MKTIDILSTDKSLYSSNEAIEVSYQNLPDVRPDSAYHLIHIVRKYGKEKLRWLPILQPTANGRKIVNINEPGEYEIHLTYNYGFEGCNYPVALKRDIRVA